MKNDVLSTGFGLVMVPGDGQNLDCSSSSSSLSSSSFSPSQFCNSLSIFPAL